MTDRLLIAAAMLILVAAGGAWFLERYREVLAERADWAARFLSSEGKAVTDARLRETEDAWQASPERSRCPCRTMFCFAEEGMDVNDHRACADARSRYEDRIARETLHHSWWVQANLSNGGVRHVGMYPTKGACESAARRYYAHVVPSWHCWQPENFGAAVR